MQTFTNPIIEGFSPDPSICAIGNDYYLVTSTFSYFPGVPIYHSKDLVNWQQIGNILEREEQLNLIGASRSQGIFAPTIRYHEGLFYMVTTNVTNGGNFYVTAKDPVGPWSNPYFIEDAPGIDPTLFFDDGRCYYIGTRPNSEGEKYDGDWEVWIQELDLKTNKLIGPSTKLWEGALREAVWPEAPHIYKRNDYYYLMISEGGTGFNHCITIARSEKLTGPYVGNKNNPILTHRHLGQDFLVQNVGHGDLVKTQEGEWFLVCLASRMFDGHDNLGRETFLAKVEWENDWPVINPGVGRLLEEQEHFAAVKPGEKTQRINLNQNNLAFLHLNNPDTKNYDNTARKNWIRLHPSTTTLSEIKSPTYMGIRQSTLFYRFSTHLEEHLKNGEEAGLAIIQNDKFYIRLAVKVKDNHKEVQLITTIDGVDLVAGRHSATSSDIELIVEGKGQQIKALVKEKDKETVIAEAVDTHYLSTAIAGGFVGCTMGIYAITTHDNPGYVDFEWMEITDHSI